MEPTQEQIGWLDKCVYGSWKLNTSTGLVDVDGNFNCNEQGLTDLKGVRFGEVSEDFDCEDNRLTSLEGAPLKVGGEFWCDGNPVSAKTLVTIFDKMQKGDSLLSAAASLRKEMSEEDWKLIAPHIPEAIRPGVSMLARFGAFG